MNIYEVIWSYSSDCYVFRAFAGMSRIAPLFVGTLDECKSFIQNNTSC